MKTVKLNKKSTKTPVIIFVLIIAAIGIGSVLTLLGNQKYSEVDVIIDAGHGGSDFGAVCGERKEKDDNLTMALKVSDKLGKLGISNRLTRNDDTFISLEDRCEIANRCGAKLYISLHRNSGEKANGVEIWINSVPSPKEIRLANTILKKLDSVGISLNRGVKTGYARGIGNYYVNKNTDMPSCLVELGFMESAQDNKLIDDNSDKYAEAIAQSISEILK